MPDIRRLDALIKPSKTDKGDGKQLSEIFVTQDISKYSDSFKLFPPSFWLSK
jgi:hypothetical protein